MIIRRVQNIEERLQLMTLQGYTYSDAEALGRAAFQLCLTNEPYHAQELLFRARTMLKQLSGDLPIVGTFVDSGVDTPFVTHSLAEAQAWGWLEIASGVFKLVGNHSGTSIVHFKRAWRIWRPWSTPTGDAKEEQCSIARYERVRAGLWLGEAWARFMSDRSQSNAHAVLRAALAELKRLGQLHLLQETIEQQQHLPPAPVGSPAYRGDGQSVPFVLTLIHMAEGNQQ